MNRLNKKSQLIDFYINNKLPFLSYSTMSSKTVKRNGKSYFISDLNLKNKELGFLSTVKKDARFYDANLCSNKSVVRENINYTYLSNLETGVYKNIVEVDINQAYFDCAFSMGVISYDTYEKGMLLSKGARLVSLGALASNKAVFEFDGKKLQYKGYKEKKEDLSYIFFQISYEIGHVVKSVFNQLNEIKANGCIGFWVDAVFVEKDFLFNAIEIINSFGYECKVKPIGSINVKIHNNTKVIWMNEIKNKNVCENFEKMDFRSKPFIVQAYKKKEAKKSMEDFILQKTLNQIK